MATKLTGIALKKSRDTQNNSSIDKQDYSFMGSKATPKLTGIALKRAREAQVDSTASDSAKAFNKQWEDYISASQQAY